MPTVSMRFANFADVGELARVHLETGIRQPAGFMFRLGRRFLEEYYRTILLEKGTVILCAESEGKIVGFISGSLRAEERVPGLRKRRLRLALAALPAILRSPSLAFQAFERQKSGSAEKGEGFIVQSGAHQEYWAWAASGTAGSLLLQKKWLSIMQILGADRVTCEVDKVNELSEMAHRVCGARRLTSLKTPDGRERLLLCYDLKPVDAGNEQPSNNAGELMNV